jgi:hypothetical protein
MLHIHRNEGSIPFTRSKLQNPLIINGSPTMRAQRAKLKSQRDDMMVAQGKRSATLGCGRKIVSSFFLLVFRAASAENQKEKRDGMGWPFTQGGSRMTPLPLLSCCPFGAMQRR